MAGDPLSDARRLVAEDLAEVERLLVAALTTRVPPLDAGAGHLLGSGGKRVRALLTVLAGQAAGVPTSWARRLAAAAELTHAASLCHDDVLDRGELRRGRATVRVRFGDAMSILLGDLCLVQAFALLAEPELTPASASLARAVVAMAEGEVVQASRAGRVDLGAAEYLEVADAKTGALLCWCATLGGLAPAALRHALDDYGRALGRVYQIVDDVLDLSSGGLSGKLAGQDLRGGTTTLPVLLAAADSSEVREQLRWLDAGVPDLEAADALVEAVRASGALQQARELAHAEADRAVAVLAILPESSHRDALEILARFAADRHA